MGKAQATQQENESKDTDVKERSALPVQSLGLITSSSSVSSSSMTMSALSAPSAKVFLSASSDPSAATSSNSKAKVIVVLVKAALWTIKTKNGYELASADTHANLLLRLKRDPAECRPDILHHSLLTLLDSPLNKAGLLQIYVQTESGQLIDVHRTCRLPRTYKRFAGLMVQLLHKLKIRSADSSQYLLRMIRNPVTDHLPVNALKIGTSVQGTLININDLATALGGGKPKGAGLSQPIVFCVGSHSTGPADVEWTEKSIAVSQYPLSAAVALGRICNAFESAWGIL